MSPGSMPDPAGKCEHPPLPRTGTHGNWVSHTGGLPREIDCVARALYWNKGGSRTVSQAVSMAVGVVRNWAEGKGKVTAATRARSAAAIARWDAQRAASKSETAAKEATKR